MTKALSRKSRDNSDDPREKARAAARRSGKSFGAWLDDAIREKAVAGHDDDDDDGLDRDDDRLEAVARRLTQSGRDKGQRRWREEAETRNSDWRAAGAGRRQDNRQDSRHGEDRLGEDRLGEDRQREDRHREDHLGDDRNGESRRDDGRRESWRRRAEAHNRDRHDYDEPGRDGGRAVEDAAAAFERRVAQSERQTAQAIGDLARLIEKSQHRDERNVVEEAVAAFDRRAKETERKTAKALNGIATLIETAPRARDEEQEDRLATVVDRLARIESRIAQQSSSASARPIRTALARLESRIDRLSSDDRTADFEEALTGLDQRLADIANRLDQDAREREVRAAQTEPAPQPPAWSAPRAEPLCRRPLADAIAEIAERRRILEQDEPRRGYGFEAAPEFPAAAAPAEDAAASRRFDELQNSIETISRQSERFDALQTSIDFISRDMEAARENAAERADQQLVAMRQTESLRRELEDLTRAIGDLAPRASVAAIETALRDLAHRIDAQRDRGAADSALAPAERIAGELRAVIKDLDPSPIVRNLHADVMTIGRRLDELKTPCAGAAEALQELSDQTREVKDLLTVMAARPLPVERLETRLLDLTQRVDSLALAGANGAGARDIGEVAKAIRSIVETETGKGFQAFNQRLERLSAKLDEALAKSGGKRFDEINERIDQLGKTLSQRIDRAGAAQKPVDTAPLESLVAKLAKKIDAALDSKTASPAFDELGRKIEKLEARLHDPAAAASIARIEALLTKPGHEPHLAELSQRIDLLHKTLADRVERAGAAQDGVELRRVEELAAELGRRIDAAIQPGAGARDFESLGRQIEQLSTKLDRLDGGATAAKLDELLTRPSQSKQLHEIAERIDFLHTSLATRIDEESRVRAESGKNEIAALVEQLTSKMNSALDPRADTGALQSLEKQIQNLARRLDRTDENGAALFSIERKIADLFQRIEETRAATTEAAEVAVRRAAQDILREAAAAEPGALNQMVERRIAEVRKSQDESGLRTHETLIAVHETLERVVDRLAVFEDELSELRDAPASAVLEAAPPRPARLETPQSVAPRFRDAQPSRPVEIDEDEELDDLLIEPDLDAAGRREPSFSAAPASARAASAEADGEGSLHSNFIAAARRAAQQAAADAEAAEAQKNAKRAAARRGPDAPAPGGGLAKAGSVLQARKRPLLLALGALVLLVGAYQVARVGISGHSPLETASHDDGAPAVEAPAAPKQSTATAPSPKFMTPPQAPSLAPSPRASGAAPSVAPPPMLSAPPGAPTGATPAQSVGPKSGNSAEGADQAPVGSIERPAASAQDAGAVVRLLAAQGDAAAQFELGARYIEGRGMPRDAKTAAQWFERAANQGLAPAQYRLGALYEKGVGVERDYARARNWYQAAAGAGNARAMHNLAVLLADGGAGKADYTNAAEWFRRAAELGVRDSQYNLAILCARGLGVAQSLPQSYAWFSAAAAQGDADAAKKRDEVGARLDGKELAAAKALADAFRPRQLNKEANDVALPQGGWENLKAPAVKPDGKPMVKPKISRL